MEFRGGPRMRGGAPHASFRHRGGGNQHQHPVHSQHHPQPRFAPPAMNQPPWNPQTPINTYTPQDEGLNYPQPPYNADVAGYNNYPYHQGLPSPELMNSNPPQTYPAYGQQMFLQPQMYPLEPVCFPQPPMVTTPPMVSTIESVSPKRFQFNSKEAIFRCAGCGHKNVLAETEIIKRDEQIEALQKDNQAFFKQNESLIADNASLRLQLESFQSQKPLESGGLPESHKSVNVEVSENTVQPTDESESMSDEAKKQSQLSPDAEEFSPKSSTDGGVAIVSAASAEVPVVSAKVIMDEDKDTPIPVQGSEAGTQVEENLFEETIQNGVTEVLAAPKHEPSTELPNEDSTSHLQYEDWSDEVDRTALQAESPRDSKEEVKTEVPQMADEVWEEEPQVTQEPEQWRGSSQTSSHTGEHWQQRQHPRPDRDRRQNNRGNRSRGSGPPPGFGRGQPIPPLGFGRGHKIQHDQEQQYNDGNRQHYSQRNRNERYNQSNQNLHRYPKPNEENWDRQKDSQHKYNNERHNRGPRYGDRNDWQEEDHQKQSDEQENRLRERSNRCRDLSYSQKRDDRNPTPRDNKDATQKTVWPRGGPNREDNVSKDSREYVPQGQGAWRGKDNNLHFNKEEIKDTSLVRNSQPNQGNFSNYNNRRDPVKVEFADIVTELSGDLFSAPGEFALAHCVAQDFRMGSGIAVKFKDEFKRVGELLDQNVQVGGCAHLEDKGRYIFYLVTKEVSTGKPKIEDLKRSLEAMKAKCLRFEVKKLAMPRIGCGLDRLDWSRVKASINEVFHDADIEIRVYEWNVEGVPEAEGRKPDSNTRLSVQYREMKLVNIDKGTALIFFGTENGHMDATATSLNEMHHFEMEYKKSERTVGNVLCFKKPNYLVFSLIVAKTPKDKVLFTKVEACLSQLSKLMRKSDYVYVGIEYPQGWSDDKTFFEKFVTLFRITLPKYIELWVCFPKAELDCFKMIKDKGGKEKGNASAK